MSIAAGLFVATGHNAAAQVAINIYLPTTGKNAVIAPYGTAELALYF